MIIKSLAQRILRSKIPVTVFGAIHYGWQQHQRQKYRQEYQIHESFRFNGDGITLYGDGDIIIKKGGHIGRYSQIQSGEGLKVDIGKNSSISHFVKMYTTNNVADQDLSQSDIETSQGDIVIGNNTWIGASVFITEDTKIGDNAVIGANSVVTRDIPPHTVASGSPAKVQKFKSYTDENFRETVLEKYSESIAERLY